MLHPALKDVDHLRVRIRIPARSEQNTGATLESLIKVSHEVGLVNTDHHERDIRNLVQRQQQRRIGEHIDFVENGDELLVALAQLIKHRSGVGALPTEVPAEAAIPSKR